MDLESRYEIRGVLGKGGLGTVYRAYDKTLKREVAIKRIATGDDGQTEEAIRQMEQEAGALAVLQHPNIVTVYDVGSDDDGPFVVMELLKGGSLDEVVEKAPLTWKDFKDFSQQIMEGMIAAQDLELLHRDLKPPNVMLNWLPSGKPQVKIVDFGLAKFSPKPSQQTLNQHDSIYGSIYYMAPEQFERASLDNRTDMYALGCVYYFALTGQSPFTGETGPQVMAAHLEHRVVPLNELRKDIPGWVCDWVMWHINRQPDDRPKDAREALGNFLELDAATQQMPGEATSPVAEQTPPSRPRLIIPGAHKESTPVASPPSPMAQTTPQPLMPPAGSKPSLHTTAQQQTASVAETGPAAPPTAPAVEPATAATPSPFAAAPPETSTQPTAPADPNAATSATTPQATTGPQPAPTLTPQAAPTATSPFMPAPAAGATAPSGPVQPNQATAAVSPPGAVPTQAGAVTGQVAAKTGGRGLSMTAKIVIGSVLAVFIVIVGLLIVNKIEDSKRAARYNEIIAVASEPTTKEIEVDEEDLQILLDSIRVGTNRSRQIVYKALSIAKGQPGMDVSASIAEFATTGILPDEIRAVLLGDVLRIRKDRSVLPFLFDYIEKTENEKVASAALRAAESVATDSEIQNFLQLIQLTPSNMIRRSAEDAAVSALEFSRKPKSYGGDFVEAMEAAVNADVRHAMIRLMGQTGAEVAADTLVETLNGKDRYDAIAALQGIAAWPNDELYPELVSFLDGQADELVRRKTFEAAISILIDPERRKERSETQQREMWTSLQRATTTTKEMFTLLSGLARVESASWAVDIAQTVANQSGNADVKAQAEGAIQRMKERAKLEGK